MSAELSVVIPSFNGAKRLPVLIEALGRQDDDDFETVVVIDGSTDGSAEVLSKASVGLRKVDVRVFENGGRSVARNRGAAYSSGRRILFLDDDMVPEPNVVRSHKEHGRENPGSILVGEQIERRERMRTDLQRFKSELRAQWSTSLPARRSRLPMGQSYLTAAHASIDREVFEVLGGFDPRLTDAEDYDLAVRAQRAGVPIFFDPKLIAWHDDFITCRTYIHRRRQYAASHRRLRELKPDLHGEGFRYAERSVPGWKRWIYSQLARPSWVRAIDEESWLSRIPKPLRYRIYEAVIWSYATQFPDRPLE